MIVYLDIPLEKFVELKKKYPIRRNENNGRLYFDTQTPYFGMFMNTGMPSVARLCCSEGLLGRCHEF